MEVRKLSDSPFGEAQGTHHSKKAIWILSLLLLCVFIGLAIPIFKTGIYPIPYLSSFYKERPVTRVVTPASLTSEQLLDRVKTAFVKPTSTKDGTVHVSFTEQELSGAFSHMLARSSRNGVRVESSQVVVLPSGFEVTATVRKDALTARVFAFVLPLVEKGRVSVVVKKMVLGDLTLPASAATQIERLVFGSELGSWGLNVGPFSLKEVRLGDGAAELVFTSSTTR
jgi:hypothetical protein